MDVDRPQSPETGTPDSSQPDSPIVAETTTPTLEITETISIVATGNVLQRSQDETEKIKEESPAPQIFSPRAYQREMLEQSLKRNVIVATNTSKMDTGSGKTQVQMPSVSMRLLTGQLNIDAWSPKVWPLILEGTRIVVSTFDVLRDALDHAFVRMDMLSLIVFDEVHNCVKNSSGRKIMMNFYHERKNAGLTVPGILGLTASPIISSDVAEIERLENTMDAICVTPTVHREQLLKHVNRPHLVRSLYDIEEFPARTPLMQRLQYEYQRMDLAKDPQVIKLKSLAVKSDEYRVKLHDAITKHNTFSQNQMKGLWTKSKDILAELGSWAADRYISQLIRAFLARFDAPDTFNDAWSNEDRTYLAGHLRQISLKPTDIESPATHDITHKVERLIYELLAAGEGVVGIIFVKERAAANVLCDLLNNYPAIQKRFRVGSVVGASSFGSRKHNIYEFLNGTGTRVLDDFRSGAINLLVATSVLEEGIDVPACNLVVCFDETTTLKSFIQRRGRARMQESKMIALESSSSDPRAWEDLEDGMKRRYADDQRELARLDELAKSEPTSSIYYIVKSSGARLDLENSRQHLEHFCQVVFRSDFVDQRPDYVFHKEESGFAGPTLRATVTLPAGLPPHLRKFQSACKWKAEKNAMKDAAFQAYVALYEEGLISEHLLPINVVAEKVEDTIELEVEPLFNPWIQIAQKWKTDDDKWVYSYEFLDEESTTPIRFEIAIPAEIPQPRDMTIHPGDGSTWSIRCVAVKRISHVEFISLPDHTSALLAMNFGHRWTVEDCSHVVKVIHEKKDFSRADIGAIPFHGAEQLAAEGRILVRDPQKTPFHYVKTIPSKPTFEQVQHPFYEYNEAPDEQYLVVEQWSRRADLLHIHKDTMKKATSKPYGRVVPISWATVDRVPRRVVKFGMLIPSIIHELEVQLIASELSSTLLEPVGISNLQLVVEAISSRSAAEPVDYERIEFLGDSILKFYTVVQAYSEHPYWPEGLLNYFKDRLVSNKRLRSVCLEKGLSKFILSKSFTGQKWRPLYLDNFLDEESVFRLSRFIGPKNLADVVEALIGASFQDGGMAKALRCIAVFLGDNCNWHEEGVGREILFGAAPSDVQLPPHMQPLEELIGYSFAKKSLLLEAVTHGSYAAETQQRSFEQLEFLGDAILDYIVVTRTFQFNQAIPNSRLHMIKTAMVNAEFLAFINMEHGISRTDVEVKPDGTLGSTEVSLRLWKFVRYSSSEMGHVLKRTEAKFESLRDEVVAAMKEGTHYPWVLLARLHSKKVFSDLVEAMLGAVWVDSGSIETCAGVLERFGILPYLDRILKENIHVQHPKEELSRLAVDQKMSYDYTVIDGPEPEYLCKVKIGDRVVGDVRGALNKEEAMAKAAEQGVKLLNAERRSLEQGVEGMDLS
ncbi:Dicer 2 [Fusarium heterosporum]|uniref:Dicer 2 n=1 Tax=Fusarium heterosporum TaxID=42747 RepID=A0A8H5WRI7_FUSHE|nr:Dicer 2 [Fusarium heterosporum]